MSGDVTRILNAIKQGDAKAADELIQAVYQELRLLGSQLLSQEQSGQTLQATALVHDAYIRLVRAEDQNWNSRGQFFAAAAKAMRRILIENARLKKRGPRRAGGLTDLDPPAPSQPIDLIALDEALKKLVLEDPKIAELVELRYFGGITLAQAAEILGIPPRTADRYWAYARAFLHRQITKGDTPIPR